MLVFPVLSTNYVSVSSVIHKLCSCSQCYPQIMLVFAVLSTKMVNVQKLSGVSFKRVALTGCCENELISVPRLLLSIKGQFRYLYEIKEDKHVSRGIINLRWFIVVPLSPGITPFAVNNNNNNNCAIWGSRSHVLLQIVVDPWHWSVGSTVPTQAADFTTEESGLVSWKEEEIFLFSWWPDQTWSPPSMLFCVNQSIFSLGVKWAGRWIWTRDHAAVHARCNILRMPPRFMA